MTVAPRASLGARGARLEDVSWIAGTPPASTLRARVRVRHRHAGADASIEASGAAATVRFDEPVVAVAPGQAAVFYAGERVLGGGWIAEGIAA